MRQNTFIESVDSIRRDSTDTYYMIIQGNLKHISFIAICHSSSSVFMTNKSPSGAKSTTKAKSQKVAKWPKCPLSFFFLGI